MSKIVFFGIPAHGHTNPTLEVVKTLVSAGHEVWYYSYNMVREKIEATGASFVSCDEFDSEQKLKPKDAARIGKDLAFSTKVLVDTTLALDDKICSEMALINPDCIVADSMAVWGKSVARKLDIPFVSSTTTFAFNKDSAKIMKQSVWDLFKMIVSLPKIGKQMKRLQDKGYHVNNVLDIIGNDEKVHTIVYTSPMFQPCSDTFSDKYAFVGPSVRPAYSEFTKTHDKLVYISMGTVNNDMLPFYKKCINVFAKSCFQVVLSVGNSVKISDFGTLPENVSVFNHVDQIAVLKKADVFVSHCGMNSVSESLYFGVPLVMLPQTTEQGGVAERVLQFGAGIKLEKNDADLIFYAVNKIFACDDYHKNAMIISDDFKACSGAVGAAEKIIQVCNG